MNRNSNKSFIAINLLIFSFIVALAFNISSFGADIKYSEEDAKIIYKTAWNTINNKYYKRADLSLWRDKFDNRIQSVGDAHKYINKLIRNLNDPYTKLLSKEEFQLEKKVINSKLIGIGIKIASINPVILNVLPNSPAEKAGIMKDDVVLSINNKKTKNLSSYAVTKLLKGPKGSEVNIDIQRKNNIFKKVVRREEIKMHPITSKLIDESIGFIRIESFISDNTSKIFKQELNLLMPTNGLIIDLRNNTGGLFKNAIEIADSLLEEGKIVSTISQENTLNEYANSNKIYSGKIILLVNKATASASEILTAALKDNNKCIVVGEKTYGKGLVQEVVELPDKSGLHVTIAEYISPNGDKINNLGISPDIRIKYDAEQVNTAIQILKNGYKV